MHSLTESEDPHCLRAGDSARLLAGHPWRRFAVLGDSVAEGLAEPLPGYSEVQFADRVARELAATAPGLDYLNLGHRGLRAREVRAGQLGPALDFEPDLALLVCGANDAFPATYKPDAVDAELRTMITALRAAGADVLTLGLFNVSYSPSPRIPDWLRPGLRKRMRELSARTSAIAEELGTLHVNLTGHPAATDPGLFAADGRHVNGRGDAIALAETVRVLGTHLAENPDRTASAGRQ
ncbi:SGNH/GDSL hydrolase family protein [Actinophytocola algeriensis]|uniref:Lysophospholipase L1-like esterase n=1 Tax=Actinophytocola algeriensis TaxID=1768010 RepID=A0A7W7QEK5_9PSEU|nr:SGNH/GDSL hydrolase family protein [Actinophytocola algeriensis]MBB4912216.1 lysophospholipase L1-like esterase [Actinophytocola algeriensis]MBE1474268.1 lysophospholipase L1-like esterase [Actinophytocola algeriensis]